MKIYRRYCKTCGKYFETTKQTWFCSDDCKMKSYPIAKCLWCGNEFIKMKTNMNFCCRDCGIKYKNKMAVIRKEENRSNSLTGEEGIDYVICRVCGQKLNYLSKQHIEFHNMTIDDYEKQYGKIKYYPSKYVNMHFNGENNPAHHTKVDEQDRKARSPFSKEFYKSRGIDEKKRNDFINRVNEKREVSTTTDYYVRRGYSEEEAKVLLSNRQRTFTLEKCISKYGEDDGYRVWKDRQDKWAEKMFSDRGRLVFGRSMECDRLIENIVCDSSVNLLYDKNELMLKDNNGKRYYYDITNEETKRIIEYNGDFWHANPNIYAPDYFNTRLKKKAYEIWERDEKKISFAKDCGYDVMVVWEDDFIKEPDAVIKRCKDFIL